MKFELFVSVNAFDTCDKCKKANLPDPINPLLVLQCGGRKRGGYSTIFIHKNCFDKEFLKETHRIKSEQALASIDGVQI